MINATNLHLHVLVAGLLEAMSSKMLIWAATIVSNSASERERFFYTIMHRRYPLYGYNSIEYNLTTCTLIE